MQGNSGIGKGTLVDLFFAVLGEDYTFVTEDPLRDVLGDFNAQAERAVAISFDEVDHATLKGHESKMKSLTTKKKRTVNQKNAAKREVGNFALFFTMHNKAHLQVVEQDNRRKILLQGVDHPMKGNKVFFDAVHTSLLRPELLKHFARKWLSIDVRGFDPVCDRVTTRLEQLSCDAAIPVAMVFLASLVEDWEVQRAAEGVESVESARSYSNGAFYDAFAAWFWDTRGTPAKLTKLLFLNLVDGALGMENTPLVAPSGPVVKLNSFWDSVKRKSARGFRVEYAALGVWLRAKKYLAAAALTATSTPAVDEAPLDAATVIDGRVASRPRVAAVPNAVATTDSAQEMAAFAAHVSARETDEDVRVAPRPAVLGLLPRLASQRSRAVR